MRAPIVNRQSPIANPLLSLRRVVGFILFVAVTYLLLVLPWPGLRELYTRYFMAMGNELFQTPGLPTHDREVWFRAPKYEHGPDKDVELAIRQGYSDTVWTTPLNSRLLGYLPAAQTIALIVATPIAWRRRVKSLVLGLLLVHAFIAIRLAVSLMYSLTKSRIGAMGELTEFWRSAVFRIEEVFTSVPTTSFVVPLLIWMLVTLRRSDFSGTARKEAAHEPGKRRAATPRPS